MYLYVAAPCDASSRRASRMHYSLIPFGATAAQPSPHIQFALSRGPRVLVQYIAVSISFLFTISMEAASIFSLRVADMRHT